MKENKFLEILKNILKPYVEEEEVLADVSKSSHLTQDLKISSYNIVEIILDMEEYFRTELADECTGRLETIGSCLNIMKQNFAIR